MRVRSRWWRRVWPALPIGIYVALALATFRDYGLTWDEQNLDTYGQRLVRWYTTLGGDAGATNWGDHHLYGGLFELLAQGAQRVSSLGLYETRHLLNAGFGALALFATFGLGRALAGPLGGFLSAALLLAHPVFYGHSFNNPKDVPFAALYALALLAGVLAVRRRRWSGVTGALLAGAAIGAALGVRVGALVLLPCLGSLWLLLALLRPAADRRSEIQRVVVRLALAAVVAWIVMVALWPYAQLDPLRHPFAALRGFHSFHGDYRSLFEGRLVRADELPRHYLPLWLTITSPEPYLALAALGVAFAAKAALSSAGPRRERAWIALWLAAISALPVIWVVLRQPPLYDGMRHFLFLLPGPAVLGAVAGRFVWNSLRSSAARAALIAAFAVALARTGREMHELHPYQSVYFNSLVGGLRGADGRYETDYWGSSYKEGVDWLAAHYTGPYRKPLRVTNTSKCILTSYYLEQPERADRFVPVCDDGGEPPHIVLTITRERRHLTLTGALVHLVSRQGVPLCYVFQARRPWLADDAEPPPRKWQSR